MPQCQFPVFCYFWVLEKLHRKKFLELDETSFRSLIFPGSFPKTEREPEWSHEGPTHQAGAAQALAAPPRCEGALAAPRRRPFAYKKPWDGKP
jgi:hypothetical protein